MLTPKKSDMHAGLGGPDSRGATGKLHIPAGCDRPDGWQTTEKSAYEIYEAIRLDSLFSVRKVNNGC